MIHGRKEGRDWKEEWTTDTLKEKQMRHEDDTYEMNKVNESEGSAMALVPPSLSLSLERDLFAHWWDHGEPYTQTGWTQWERIERETNQKGIKTKRENEDWLRKKECLITLSLFSSSLSLITCRTLCPLSHLSSLSLISLISHLLSFIVMLSTSLFSLLQLIRPLNNIFSPSLLQMVYIHTSFNYITYLRIESEMGRYKCDIPFHSPVYTVDDGPIIDSLRNRLSCEWAIGVSEARKCLHVMRTIWNNGHLYSIIHWFYLS